MFEEFQGEVPGPAAGAAGAVHAPGFRPEVSSLAADRAHGPAAGGASVGNPAVEGIQGIVRTLSSGGTDMDEAALVDLLAGLEAAKASAAAYQARAAVALRARVIEREEAAGTPREKLGEAVGEQVALARRESPFQGGRLLGFARAVVNEMPHTHQAFRDGRISEWRATLLVRETACLDLEDRMAVDEALMSDPETTEGVGNRRLVAMARNLAVQASATAVVRRARRAVGGRHVSLRPAADTMSVLSGILPVAQGVAVFKALSRAADFATGEGDPRSRGQVMADTLVERVTGQKRAADVRVEVQLVMTDRALFQGDVEPAHLQGYGVLPAQIARDIVRDATRPAGVPKSGDDVQGGASPVEGPEAGSGGGSGGGSGARPTGSGGPRGSGGGKPLVWIRRLYTAPGTGDLVGLDSRARLFPPGLRRFIELRDQVCSRPWCDAPIRQMDHVLAWAAGGGSTAANGQGLCARCNHTKEAPGWSSREVAGGRHMVETTTPTGHAYRSQAPALPGTTD